MAQSQLVIRYLLMVGIPLGVVLVMLEAGKGLTAPPPIAGDWRLEEPAATQPIAGSCPVEPLFGGSGAFTLGQAGQFLTMKATHTLYGRIEQNVLRLESEAPAGLFVTARVVRTPEALRMEGSVGRTDSQVCSPSGFSARLVPGAVRAAPFAGSR